MTLAPVSKRSRSPSKDAQSVGPDIGTSAALFAAAAQPGRFLSLVVGSGGSAVPLQLGEPLREWVFAPLIQSLLRRGAVDELQIDIMPVLLREGLRLFEHLGDKENALERVGVHALAHGRTALRFAVKDLTHARS